MNCCKIITCTLIIASSLFANQYPTTKKGIEKTLFCLYPELKQPIEILKDEELTSKDHIENLLYSKVHDKEYFLKALVLDYLYNASNIEDFYKNAYIKADIKNKDQIGLYYAIYLQKNGDYKKAISLLRGIEIFASEKYNIPTKVAYAYKLSSAKEDIRTNSYLKVKKIDLKKIEENIGDCNN